MKPNTNNCTNCYWYWGCRMADNPNLNEDDRPGCSKYRPKKQNNEKTQN